MSDQPDKPIETPKVWIRYAEGDFAVARRELESETPVYHTLCFLCQSSAEKFILPAEYPVACCGVPRLSKTRPEGAKFRNTPSACSGDRNFEGFANLFKGFLISQGWVLQRTHDLVELLSYCLDYDEELGSMVAEGAILNEYIVAGRYPGDLAVENIDRSAAIEALD